MMTPCDLELFLEGSGSGWSLARRPFNFELKFLGENVARLLSEPALRFSITWGYSYSVF